MDFGVILHSGSVWFQFSQYTKQGYAHGMTENFFLQKMFVNVSDDNKALS